MALGTGVASLVCVALLCPFLTDKSRYFPAFPLGWPPAGLPGPLPLPLSWTCHGTVEAFVGVLCLLDPSTLLKAWFSAAGFLQETTLCSPPAPRPTRPHSPPGLWFADLFGCS